VTGGANNVPLDIAARSADDNLVISSFGEGANESGELHAVDHTVAGCT
jgi:hypothetical protein